MGSFDWKGWGKVLTDQEAAEVGASWNVPDEEYKKWLRILFECPFCQAGYHKNICGKRVGESNVCTMSICSEWLKRRT